MQIHALAWKFENLAPTSSNYSHRTLNKLHPLPILAKISVENGGELAQFQNECGCNLDKPPLIFVYVRGTRSTMIEEVAEANSPTRLHVLRYEDIKKVFWIARQANRQPLAVKQCISCAQSFCIRQFMHCVCENVVRLQTPLYLSKHFCPNQYRFLIPPQVAEKENELLCVFVNFQQIGCSIF